MSKGRELYEARMKYNPDKAAELLAASPYRKHKIRVANMLATVKNAQEVVKTATVNTEGNNVQTEVGS